MIKKTSMRMIDEDNNNKKIKNECWSVKVKNYVTNRSVNFKTFV